MKYSSYTYGDKYIISALARQIQNEIRSTNRSIKDNCQQICKLYYRYRDMHASKGEEMLRDNNAIPAHRK